MEAIKEAWKSITWTKKNIQDLHGLTIMVTGATDGVGFECARAYAEHGAHVIVHGRNKEKGDEAVAEIKKTASQNAKVELMLCDLSVLQSIREMVDQYKQKGYPLHVLINNAGIQAPRGHRGEHTADGIEITFASNYYGPLYLTELLLPIIKKTTPAGSITKRIIWVTSIGSQLANPPVLNVDLIPWNDLKAEHYNESDWWQYARTKLFNLMAVREESRRLETDHIDVVAAHPGMATTDHFGKADTDNKLSSWMIETWAKSPIGQSKEAGAVALEYAGVSPDVNGKTGWYVGTPELGLINVGNAHLKEHPRAPLANNPEASRRFYNKTLAILKQCDPSFDPSSGPIEQDPVMSSQH